MTVHRNKDSGDNVKESKTDNFTPKLLSQTSETAAGQHRAEQSKKASLKMEDQGIIGNLAIFAQDKDTAAIKAPSEKVTAIDLPDFRDQHGPPAIRYNNPGAMYPHLSSYKFGSRITHTIRDGHLIAEFPDAISGAAAQFDLLNSAGYRDMSVGSAIRKWCGNNSTSCYLNVLERGGINLHGSVSEALSDKNKAIELAKTMAKVEAGREYPLNKEQWGAAFDKYKEHINDPPKERPLDHSNDHPHHSHKRHHRDHGNHHRDHHHHRWHHRQQGHRHSHHRHGHHHGHGQDRHRHGQHRHRHGHRH